VADTHIVNAMSASFFGCSLVIARQHYGRPLVAGLAERLVPLASLVTGPHGRSNADEIAAPAAGDAWLGGGSHVQSSGLRCAVGMRGSTTG
jgi:hypothetical protein